MRSCDTRCSRPSELAAILDRRIVGVVSLDGSVPVLVAVVGAVQGRGPFGWFGVSQLIFDPVFMKASSGKVWRFAHGAAGRQFEFDAAQGCETFPGELCQITGFGMAAAYRLTQDDAHFFLH